MDQFKIQSFAQFQKSLYESIETPKLEEERHVEKTKTVYNDTRGKVKTDDTKIKVAMGTPDGSKGEVFKFDFKYVDSSNITPEEAKKKAIGELDAMLKSQVAAGTLSDDMIGIIDVEKAQTRMVGDYVYKGAVTIYNANAFKPEELASATPLNPTANQPNQPTAQAGTAGTSGKTGTPVSEEATRPLYELKIYDATTVKAPEKISALKQMVAAAKAPQPASTSGTSGVSGTSPVTSTSGTSGPPADMKGSSGSSGTSGATAAPVQPTVDYTGLKKNLNFDQRVKDLQQLIISKGGPAADLLKQKGGADGKYGDMTAQAISQIVYGSTANPVQEITKEISDAINQKLPNTGSSQIAQAQPGVVSVKTNNQKVPTLYF